MNESTQNMHCGTFESDASYHLQAEKGRKLGEWAPQGRKRHGDRHTILSQLSGMGRSIRATMK